MGFHISPVLWRRLPGAKSAGRVQSVALRLVSTREDEIDAFIPTEYWSVESILRTAKGDEIRAKLTHIDGSKVTEMGIGSQSEADAVVERLEATKACLQVEDDPILKQIHRKPPAPFTTSTMQQEASKKLGFNATRTMKAAQELYEGAGTGEGLITYMRTDGVQMSPEAVEEVRDEVKSLLGKEYVSSSIRVYKTKAKNAQEAHEAIRPIKPQKGPEALAQVISGDLMFLYDLIWRRTLSSQMSDAVSEQVSIIFESQGLKFKASGTTLTFPGYLKVLSSSVLSEDESGLDEEAQGGGRGDQEQTENDDSRSRALSQLKKGDNLQLVKVIANQHFTRPPPRFTDASLIKAMEELGIGRPSTYATVLNVLSSRGYVTREGRALVPSGLGRVLTAFLKEYFPRYVDYGFTSGIEEQLDEVSDGKLDWAGGVLDPFWSPFRESVQSVMKNTSITDVYDVLDERLGPYLFRSGGGSEVEVSSSTSSLQSPAATDPRQSPAATDPRQCPLCKDGRLSLKPSSQAGGFIGCSNYATKGCRFGRPLIFSPTSDLGEDDDGSLLGTMVQEGQEIGLHPETGLPLVIKSGPYGLFIEEVLSSSEAIVDADGDVKSDESEGRKNRKGRPKKPKPPKPRRGSLPKDIQPSQVTLTLAVALLALPKVLGAHPSDHLPVSVNTGRFGPYVSHNGTFASLSSFLKSKRGTDADDDRSMAEILISKVSLDDAVRIVDAKREKVVEKEAKSSSGAKGTGKETKSSTGAKAKGREANSAGSRGRRKASVGDKEMDKKAPAGEEGEPKRVRSGYQVFVKTEFADTKASLQMESSEVVKMGQVSAALGRKWKEMSDEDKARYREPIE